MELPEWVVVSGGVHRRGGMERANAALVCHLLDRGATVHLVAHEVDDELRRQARLRTTLVALPAGVQALTDVALTRAGRRVAAEVRARAPRARIVVNGGNCPWPDVNWVHYVHHAWEPRSSGPAWHRLKERAVNAAGRRAERRALAAARLVIVNSELTRCHVTGLLGVPDERIRTIHLGAETAWLPPGPGERADARRRFGLDGDDPVIAFVGGLGHDERKGFDILLAAWKRLTLDLSWRATLLVAGGGRRLAEYTRQSRDCRNPIRFLGHTSEIATVLAASDLLIGPSRYEPYGLNVQEALARGVPAITSRRSGVAARYPPSLEGLLVDNPEDVAALVEAVNGWRSARERFRGAALDLSGAVRRYSWRDMADAFVSAALAAEGAPIS
jgi:glycosyltransferase involved in cell wall biosynthesis